MAQMTLKNIIVHLSLALANSTTSYFCFSSMSIPYRQITSAPREYDEIGVKVGGQQGFVIFDLNESSPPNDTRYNISNLISVNGLMQVVDPLLLDGQTDWYRPRSSKVRNFLLQYKGFLIMVGVQYQFLLRPLSLRLG
jgi:hypothetical protein